MSIATRKGGVCWAHRVEEDEEEQAGYCTVIKKQQRPKRVMESAPKRVPITRKKRICSEEGCMNFAVDMKDGVCCRHGAKLKLCSHTGCGKRIQSGGVCYEHGAPPKECSKVGCTNRAKHGSRGRCAKHAASVTKCRHEHCENNAQKEGLCLIHWAKQIGQVCSFEGCVENALEGGICEKHGKNVGSKGRPKKKIVAKKTAGKPIGKMKFRPLLR